MKNCLFCNGKVSQNLSIQKIFSFHTLEEELTCPKCFEQFIAINPKTACPGCSRQQEEPDWCSDCIKWKKYLPSVEPRHKALFEYNEMARQYMNAFKFQGDVVLAKVFREQLKKALKPYLKTHRITTIPSRSSSYQKRGFNQVELLLKSAEIPYDSLIIHAKETVLQSSQNRQERLRAVQPFEMNDRMKHENMTKPVLILDDVYTTGRTIFHARELLETSVMTSSISLFR